MKFLRAVTALPHVSHVSTYTDTDYVQKVYDHIINSVNLSGTVSRIVVTSSNRRRDRRN